MSRFVRACSSDELGDGVPLAVEVDGEPVCLVRVPDGVFAFDDVCPHRGAQLSRGTLAGTTIMCAAHTWEFDVTTGDLLRLRAPECLAMREAREADGVIEVEARTHAAAEAAA